VPFLKEVVLANGDLLVDDIAFLPWIVQKGSLAARGEQGGAAVWPLFLAAMAETRRA
jgi:hypothetical protein